MGIGLAVRIGEFGISITDITGSLVFVCVLCVYCVLCCVVGVCSAGRRGRRAIAPGATKRYVCMSAHRFLFVSF